MLYEVRNQGKTIGLTHGAFDLFHYGHYDLLKKAADKCDFLLVGIDSDYNISKYKSVKRPIIPEQERLKIISELNCVDGVFVNNTDINNDAYMQLYRNLYINCIFTGRNFDYKEELKYRTSHLGCDYKIINAKVQTTTDIINKIVSRYKT